MHTTPLASEELGRVWTGRLTAVNPFRFKDSGKDAVMLSMRREDGADRKVVMTEPSSIEFAKDLQIGCLIGATVEHQAHEIHAGGQVEYFGHGHFPLARKLAESAKSFADEERLEVELYPVAIVQHRFSPSWFAIAKADQADVGRPGMTRATWCLTDGPNANNAHLDGFDEQPWMARGQTPDEAIRALLAKTER